MIDTNTPNKNVQIEEVTIGKPKRGPPVSTVWSYAFDDPTSYSTTGPNTKCKHCKESVQHRHKTASVRAHLRKCSQFKKVMLDMAVTDRPDWWTDQKGTAKKSMSSKSSSSVGSNPQSSIRSFSVPCSVPQNKRGLIMRWQCIFTAQAQVFRGLKIHFSFGLSNWCAQVLNCQHAA